MTVLAIAPMHDTDGKRDASAVFVPQARAFCRLHKGRLMTFDSRQPKPARFTDVIDWLAPMRDVEAVGFFMHGFRSGLQCGAHMRNVHVLAASLRQCGVRVVALYACDTARDLDARRDDDMVSDDAGDGGFASALSAALPGVAVYGHPVTAHATRAPYVRRFVGGGAGEWVVPPSSPWWRHWRAALQDDEALRLSFPLWPRERLIAELARRAAAA